MNLQIPSKSEAARETTLSVEPFRHSFFDVFVGYPFPFIKLFQTSVNLKLEIQLGDNVIHGHIFREGLDHLNNLLFNS